MKGKDGQARGRWSCDRLFESESFASRRPPSFSTPRNVFLFGRGGRSDLRCKYLFRGRVGRERVRLRLERIGNGGAQAQCSSSSEHDLLPGLCSGGREEGPRLRVYLSEVPDGTARAVRQHCLCEALSYDDRGLSFLSNTSALMVEFVVENMRPDQDYDDFYLSGSFSFVRPEPSCPLNGVATGAGGEILLKRSHSCNDAPWVIRASRPGKYIFLKIAGSLLYAGRSDGRDLRNITSSSLSPRWCQTADRVYVYSGSNVTVVCPATAGSRGSGGGGPVRSVELFSDGWDRARLPFLPQPWERPRDSSVTVRFSGASPVGGPYLLQWLELSPDPDRADAVAVSLDSEDLHSSSMSSRRSSSSSSSSCAFSCPELSGCIRAELYCDGVRHCPSGFDEREENCAHVFAPLLYMYAVAIVTVAAVICVAIAVVQRMRSRTGFRSNENLDEAEGSVVVAAYNPGVVGVNGYSNGDYQIVGESVTNLARSASVHSNVDDSGFLVVEADVVAHGGGSPMPVIEEEEGIS